MAATNGCNGPVIEPRLTISSDCGIWSTAPSVGEGLGGLRLPQACVRNDARPGCRKDGQEPGV